MSRGELARQQSTHLVLAELKAACANCNLRELCLPAGLSNEELDQLDNLVNVRRKIKRGEALYRAGEIFDAIYAVRSGFFKSRVTYEDGRDQATGFSMETVRRAFSKFHNDGLIECEALRVHAPGRVRRIPDVQAEKVPSTATSLFNDEMTIHLLVSAAAKVVAKEFELAGLLRREANDVHFVGNEIGPKIQVGNVEPMAKVQRGEHEHDGLTFLEHDFAG